MNKRSLRGGGGGGVSQDSGPLCRYTVKKNTHYVAVMSAPRRPRLNPNTQNGAAKPTQRAVSICRPQHVVLGSCLFCS